MMQKMKEQDQTKSTNIKWHNLTIDRDIQLQGDMVSKSVEFLRKEGFHNL